MSDLSTLDRIRASLEAKVASRAEMQATIAARLATLPAVDANGYPIPKETDV